MRRTGRGRPSIVPLGVAHELLKEGPGLQALSGPHPDDAARWGVRLFALNRT